MFVVHLAKGGTFISTKVATVKKVLVLGVPELGAGPSPITEDLVSLSHL